MLRKHLLHVGGTAPSTVSGRGGGACRDLRKRAGALSNRALDRLVFDVVAAADGFEAADRRMQRLVVVSIHLGRG